MNIFKLFGIFIERLKSHSIEKVLSYRIQYYNRTLRSHHTVIWNYGFRWLDSIEIGKDVTVMANAEIVVFKHAKHSSKLGRLKIGDNVVITTGVNVRAAGGSIVIGENSGVGELSVLVAANHSVKKGDLYLQSQWDENKTDVILGNNVWVGANCSLLPGTRIGDNSVLAAGSVVSKEIPANEIWGGVPARKIRDV